VTIGESVVNANGVDLCVETFGDAADPAILLISGTPIVAGMLVWDVDACERLAAASRFVIRYDLRDLGRSESYPPGSPQYSLRDLVADAVGLLDVFGLARAHLVGFALGGWVAQLAALDHPDRVDSLTLVSTRPNAMGPTDPDLPEHSERLMSHIMDTPDPDWANRSEVIDAIVDSERVLSSSPYFDEAAIRQRAERVVDRATNIESSFMNHAAMDPGDRWRERLGEIRARTLGIHGTEDLFFPVGNARALAREIRDADLLLLENMGHELPPPVWETVVAALLRHTSGA